MATISLSPSPAPVASVMTSRRGPLTNNTNAANSPLRVPGAALNPGSKPKRSLANVLREENYGQPPPKKQALDNGSQRPRSPTKVPRPQVMVQRDGPTKSSKNHTSASRSATTAKSTQAESIDKETWKTHFKAKFPKMVFYFESVPDDVRARLTRRIAYLGARQEPFFSNEVTHVITTRPIPSEQAQPQEVQQENRSVDEQPKTINPSLLDRNVSAQAQRKLFTDFRHVQPKTQQLNDPLRISKTPRNNDVLYKARDMGKRIWALDKFTNIVNALLENETQQSTAARAAGSRVTGPVKETGHLLTQMLQNERLNGPSDRDPTASNRELHHFKGPYLYIYDMDEKQKPIMVREYAKVASKSDGDWPQFRSVGNGRCPFVEEVDAPRKRKMTDQERQKEQDRELQKEKARHAAAKREFEAMMKPPQAPPPKAVTGKRTLAEMEDGQSRGRNAAPQDILDTAKLTLSKQEETRSQIAFTSRAPGGRVCAGEPVASGLQKNTATSAIRSQMISSTAGMSGVKAGTSREIHGLQRQVLQKTAPASQASSRQATEVSGEPSSRPATLSRTNSRSAPTQEPRKAETIEKTQAQPLKSKKDLKPGYCENCQDKFRDFDEHIASGRHRKFADSPDNWVELDSLLAELKRVPKHEFMQLDLPAC